MHHTSRIFLIALLIVLSLNSCVQSRYVQKNKPPVKKERRQQRENRRENSRDGLKNERSFGPFTFIFPQVLA